MKTELKAKFLQHLVGKKKDDQGFTLIELLVVIIIIGILSAIALPTFLNQAKKARQSEARTYVGSMNRGQQAFYTENDAFTSSIDAMGVGIATQTANYVYLAIAGNGAIGTQLFAANYSNSANTGSGLKNYGGIVSLRTASSEVTSQTFMCETLAVDVSGAGNAVNTSITSTACLSTGKLIK
jgi:prepilin-type N-terminal cleavage/methylation domain-containing protein